MAHPTSEIRSVPVSSCALCGSNGVYIYRGQRDRLFCASGLWNLKRCSNPKCGLIWLDPMPVPEELGKAYEHYYTHSPRKTSKRPGLLRNTYALMKRGYQADKYGYQSGSVSFWIRSLGKLLHLFPIRRSDVDAEIRYLQAIPQGRLLDVGCGSGEWLIAMRDLGWHVEGIDFDQNAVEAARQLGLTVRCGSLEQQRFAENSFDVVTMNHVIEHVPDPVGTLAECVRLLKHGGRLVLFTPNSRSLAHVLFKEHWRGLEPPRHLHLFNPSSIKAVLRAAGFKDVVVRTVNSLYIWEYSLMLWTRRVGTSPHVGARIGINLTSNLLAHFEQALLVAKRDAGECLAVQALAP